MKIWILKLIEKNGYASQRQFAFEFFRAKTEAEKATASSAFNRILSGQRQISFAEACRLRDLLNVSLDEISKKFGY